MKNRYTKEWLSEAIQGSDSWAEVCRKVGVKPATGAQTHLKNRAIHFQIDYSHMTGQAWRKGMIFGPKKPIEYWLTENSTIKSDDLRIRLIQEGLKEAKCENCDITEWCGDPAPLELDHKNRIHDDNRLENLQIFCPNCHALKTRKDRFQARLAQRQEAHALEA